MRVKRLLGFDNENVNAFRRVTGTVLIVSAIVLSTVAAGILVFSYQYPYGDNVISIEDFGDPDIEETKELKSTGSSVNFTWDMNAGKEYAVVMIFEGSVNISGAITGGWSESLSHKINNVTHIDIRHHFGVLPADAKGELQVTLVSPSREAGVKITVKVYENPYDRIKLTMLLKILGSILLAAAILLCITGMIISKLAKKKTSHGN